METTRRTLILLVVLTLSLGANAQRKDSNLTKREGTLRVTVRSLADPTKAYPDSRLYLAEVTNARTTPMRLQPIQMPGGYVGSGTFFPCSIETRNKNGKWATLNGTRTAIAQSEGPPPRDVELMPGKTQEVCRALLPHEGGRSGDCVRFRMKLGWSKTYSYLLSDSFQISRGSDLRACP